MTVVTVDEAPDVEHRLIAPDDVVEELGPFLVPREHGFPKLQANVTVFGRE